MGWIAGISMFCVVVSKNEVFIWFFQLLLYFSCKVFNIFIIVLCMCSQCQFPIGWQRVEHDCLMLVNSSSHLNTLSLVNCMLCVLKTSSRAQRPLRAYVLCVLMYQCVLGAYVLTCLMCLHAHVPNVLCILRCLVCLHANMPHVLNMLTCQCVLHAYILTCQHTLQAHVWTCHPQ